MPGSNRVRMRHGTYSRLLFDAFRPRRLFLNDLCPKMEACCGDLLKEHRVSFLPGDAETIPFPAGTSLITSCSALQWFESPEKFFERCNALLRSRVLCVQHLREGKHARSENAHRQRTSVPIVGRAGKGFVAPLRHHTLGGGNHTACIPRLYRGALPPQTDRSERSISVEQRLIQPDKKAAAHARGHAATCTSSASGTTAFSAATIPYRSLITLFI